MLQINQVKLQVSHKPEQLAIKVAEILHIPQKDIQELHIMRQSIDARRKPELFYIYTVNVLVKKEEQVYKRMQRGKQRTQVQMIEPVEYHFPTGGQMVQKNPTVVVGTGPAGLFCGYYLALHGYRPILLERGMDVDTRKQDVEDFWNGGALKPDSNVQFGEGGAGTFSDGKLNTVVKDKSGRNREVLKTFIRFGAKESILYDAKPHVGTDVLMEIVRAMREEIIRLGGQVRFGSCMTDVKLAEGKVCGVMINDEELLPCETLVLAPGHSARDTFEKLYERDIPMEAKSFAVGMRVVHPQEMINRSQYGMEEPGELGAAPYKVTARTQSGRGVYSFCMCPGGYVVNASSEEGRLAVNGMSYSGRDGACANSAIIVSVTPEDYGSAHPLAGMHFQRELEEKAFRLADGKIPAQRYGDFREAVAHPGRTEALAEEAAFIPDCKGVYAWADVSQILPKECNQAFVEGMEGFGRQIEGFDRPDAVVLGVESRTSSPVRMPRDESLQTVGIEGLYPCGEGAGYAGGITSAAMDGLRVAEAIATRYAPFDS